MTTIDKNFTDTKRRLRWLAGTISDIERTMTIATHDDKMNAAIYIMQQHEREYEQTSYLVSYYERQNYEYRLSKFQWSMFVVSLVIALALLVLFFLDRLA